MTAPKCIWNQRVQPSKQKIPLPCFFSVYYILLLVIQLTTCSINDTFHPLLLDKKHSPLYPDWGGRKRKEGNSGLFVLLFFFFLDTWRFQEITWWRTYKYICLCTARESQHPQQGHMQTHLSWLEQSLEEHYNILKVKNTSYFLTFPVHLCYINEVAGKKAFFNANVHPAVSGDVTALKSLVS